MSSRLFLLPFLYILIFYSSNAFNIDTNSPIYKSGPHGSYFGFSVASHFRSNQPIILVGAPRAESGQPNTTQAGAVFGCELEFDSKSSSQGCKKLQFEYANQEDYRKPPRQLGSYKLHSDGKNYQLLGFVVHSSGSRNGPAIACAPLLRFGDSAFTDGTCYVLNNDLTQNALISTCNPLPKEDRHNEYGTCEQGFSAFIDENVILTGLPGARKWTGGVFSRYHFMDNNFPESVDRWTMEVDKSHDGIINILASHDYLGFSVRRGKFGFWYEEENGSNFTIVSGATRYMQNGSVIFLPFRKKAMADEQKHLGLDANFTLIGKQLGSGFGYAVEVADLNNDGFDDLIVSAPFEFYFNREEEYGGAVYIYFSRGKRQSRGDNHLVFHDPIVLRGPEAHSQFGMALARLGNVDNDPNNYEDFAIGAPYADNGRGVVFIYQGSTKETFRKEPSQSIFAKSLTSYTGKTQLSSFGGSLAGSVDLDGNRYGDLVVGAYDSDVVVILRARPVINVNLNHELKQQYINIDEIRGCGNAYRTCFDLTTVILVANRNNTKQLADFSVDPFQCSLKVIPLEGNVKARATIEKSGTNSYTWQCGRNSVSRENRQIHKILIPKTNQDWMSPLRFNFTVKMRENAVSQEILPIINQYESMHSFNVDFDKQCGSDNKCQTDLSVQPVLLNMTRNESAYTMKVTERDSILIRFVIENKGERAYSSKLYVQYNSNELDEPQVLNSNTPSIDKEKVEDDYAVIALGNPLELQAKLRFDLSFKLVRGSSERISAALLFNITVNSTSTEQHPHDNHWQAEVQLIKEADLEIVGVSDPVIVHFSGGSAKVSDEEDIGPQVIHRYTITNHGPFYARNVSAKIDWPLQINTNNKNRWALYILEPPVIRHNGKVHQCSIDPYMKAINPDNIYNDETLTLAYGREIEEKEHRRHKRTVVPEEKAETRIASIFSSTRIKPKKAREPSGAEISIIDVNCDDETAKCYPLVCHFEYIGTKESALIEVRARLWNYTFSGDYHGIEYVAITSKAHIELDPAQGIIEDSTNNFARVTTQAYPDRPKQEMKFTWWLLLLAILIALLLLAILILILVKCGFFKRKRLGDPLLHQAEYSYQKEQYSET